MTENVLQSPDVQGCLLQVMLDAVEAGEVWEMQAQLEMQIEETPALYYACHDIGHLAGRRAYELAPDIGRLIVNNPSATCAYGIGHGVLDGFGDDSPGYEEFRAAADACATKEGMSAWLCADGIGHAAWEASGDLAQASVYCELLDYWARAACSEGIMMQIYEPAGSGLMESPESVFAELPGVCESWPSSDKDVIRGCHAGAGYLYTREAWFLESVMVGGQRDRESAQLAIVDKLVRAGDLCRMHHDQFGVDACLGSVAKQVPYSLYEEESLFERACAALGSMEALCLSWNPVVE